MQQSVDGEDNCEILTSGHHNTVAHITSQQLWLPAQGLCKIKPVKYEWGIINEGPTFGGRVIGC